MHARTLFEVAQQLCDKNGLTLKEKIEASTREVFWVAESQNEFFYGNYAFGFILSKPGGPFVSMTDVLEFKDFIKSVTSTKGLFFTTGYFTRDVYQPLEGPKVSLYNRRKILEEFKRLGLKWR